MKASKLLPVALCLVSVLSVLPAPAADAVAPQTLMAVPLYRDVVSIGYSTNVHFTQGAPLVMTNMLCYATGNLGTNSVLQGLDQVTVEVATSVSSTTTGTWSAASVQIASNGTWWIALTNLPSANSIYWQCRITDVNTNVYYYQQQIINADPHL